MDPGEKRPGRELSLAQGESSVGLRGAARAVELHQQYGIGGLTSRNHCLRTHTEKRSGASGGRSARAGNGVSGGGTEPEGLG